MASCLHDLQAAACWEQLGIVALAAERYTSAFHLSHDLHVSCAGSMPLLLPGRLLSISCKQRSAGARTPRLTARSPCPPMQLILLVEDSVKFYSSYLPMIYGEVLSLSHSIAKETMSAKERLMRMHSRPKVRRTCGAQARATITRQRVARLARVLPSSCRAGLATLLAVERRAVMGRLLPRQSWPRVPVIHGAQPHAKRHAANFAGAPVHKLRGGDRHLLPLLGQHHRRHHRRWLSQGRRSR